MTITDIDKQFEKKFMGEFCDGQGNGCYWETAPKILDFIHFYIDQAKAEQREEIAKMVEGMKKLNRDGEEYCDDCMPMEGCGCAMLDYNRAVDDIAKEIRRRE